MTKIEKQKLLAQLLKYSESIAHKYYIKHYGVFENDTFSMQDLKQEAKIICLKIFKKYYKFEGKNNFNLKKFTSRAVGWRMRDLLNEAITESETFLHQNGNVPFDDKTSHISSLTSEDTNDGELPSPQYLFIDTFDLPNDLKYGFVIENVFKQFDEKDLTTIKYMLKYKDETKGKKKTILSYFKTAKDAYRYWQSKLVPKLKKMLGKYKKESVR